MVAGARLSYGVVDYGWRVAVVGLGLRRIGLLMELDWCVYGPVVEWLVFGDVRQRSAWRNLGLWC